MAERRPSDSEYRGLSGPTIRPVTGVLSTSLAVTWVAKPWSGLPVVHPQPDFPACLLHNPVSLTGLVALGGPLVPRCLLKRPAPGGRRLSASARGAGLGLASLTPLSSLRVCPLSESWEMGGAAVGTGGEGCVEAVAVWLPGGAEGQPEGWVGDSWQRLPATLHLLRPALPPGLGPKAANSRMSALTASGKMVKKKKKKVRGKSSPQIWVFFVCFNS